jgi:hypothetical protein
LHVHGLPLTRARAADAEEGPGDHSFGCTVKSRSLGHGRDTRWPTPLRTCKCSSRTKETMSSQVNGSCACAPSARLWLHDGCMAARRACESRAWGVCAGGLRARPGAEARAVSSPGARAPALAHVGDVTLILCGSQEELLRKTLQQKRLPSTQPRRCQRHCPQRKTLQSRGLPSMQLHRHL